MSALTGIPGADGRILVAAPGVPAVFRCGMAFDSAGALCTAASAPGGFSNGSCMMDAGGFVMTTAGAIVQYVAGLPVDANGALCVEAAAAVSFDQGVGFTSNGRIATT